MGYKLFYPLRVARIYSIRRILSATADSPSPPIAPPDERTGTSSGGRAKLRAAAPRSKWKSFAELSDSAERPPIPGTVVTGTRARSPVFGNSHPSATAAADAAAAVVLAPGYFVARVCGRRPPPMHARRFDCGGCARARRLRPVVVFFFHYYFFFNRSRL